MKNLNTNVLLALISVVLIIIGWSLAASGIMQQKEPVNYTKYEKMRTEFHNIIEDQSLENDHLKASLQFSNDTLSYSLHYFIQSRYTAADWIRQGEETNEYLRVMIPFTGVNVIKLKFWENGNHLYSLFYKINYLENDTDSVSFVLDQINKIQ